MYIILYKCQSILNENTEPLRFRIFFAKFSHICKSYKIHDKLCNKNLIQ
jgi:hypothetical protein